MVRRSLLWATAILALPVTAMADESIAGPWQADMGHGVIIAMDIIADGHWSSETVQNDRVVAELAGTYKQQKKTETTGMLIFTPVTAKTSKEHGAAKVEPDEYTLEQGRQVLRLVTGGETMEFHKQPFAK
jgi:hypothetical protein